MTEVAYVHGIENELSDRGKMVKSETPYIPYTDMTAGEMKLALLLQQAEVYAAAYPEDKTMKQAVSMLENALYQGVHGGYNFLGSIPKNLQGLAREIATAKYNVLPAAGRFYTGSRPYVQGIHLGDPLVTSAIPEDNCEDYATRVTNEFYGISWSKFVWKTTPNNLAKKQRWLSNRAECEVQKQIEALYNDKLESASHHVLYFNINPLFGAIKGTRVDIKRILHTAGIGALANAGKLSPGLMKLWVDTGILRTNSLGNVGPIRSVETSFQLAEDPQAIAAAYARVANTNEKKDKISIEPVTTAAILTLVATALTVAGNIVTSVLQKRAGAFTAAQGFGTPAYSAETSDWTGVTPSSNTPTNLNSMLPWLLIGGGVWAATQE